MSEFSIKDGTGQGYRAKVSSTNRLLTSANTQSTIAAVSNLTGEAFSFTALEKSLTAATDTHVLWMKNTNPSHNFLINRIAVSHNGGTTSHNKVITVRIRIGSTTPAANATSFIGGSLNLSKISNVPLMESYYWNGVGSGMTIAAPGTLSLSAYYSQGFTDVIFDGSFVLGYNNIIDCSLEAEENSLASFIVSGWYDTL